MDQVPAAGMDLSHLGMSFYIPAAICSRCLPSDSTCGGCTRFDAGYTPASLSRNIPLSPLL